MGLKLLFGKSSMLLDLAIGMLPEVDTKLIVFFAGVILGYLEMNGYADPASHSQNLDSLEQLLGALITVSTIGFYFINHAVIEVSKLKYGNNPQPTTATITTNDLLTKIKKFIFTS